MKNLNKFPYLIQSTDEPKHTQPLPHTQRMTRISKLSHRIQNNIKQSKHHKGKDQFDSDSMHKLSHLKSKRYETDISTVCSFSDNRGEYEIQNILNNANTYKFNSKFNHINTNIYTKDINPNIHTQRITKNPLNTYNKIPKILKTKITNISQLIINILWIDLQLSKTINIFPMQLGQLQQHLPDKNLRPILKLINTIIDTNKKQIKNDDNSWKQIAIYLLEMSYREWQTRWQLQQYQKLVAQKNKIGMNHIIGIVLDQMGVDEKLVMTRGLVMRYLMDVDQ